MTEHGLVGGRGVWPYLLYVGLLIFLGGSIYTKQTEFYAWTITKERCPILYWCVMSTAGSPTALKFGCSARQPSEAV